MKVLIVFHGDDYAGGTSFSTFTIAAGLAERGHEVHAYVHCTAKGVLKRDLEDAGVVVHDGLAPALTLPLKENRPLFRLAQHAIGEYLRFVPYPRSEREVLHIIQSFGIELVAISSSAIMTGERAARQTGTPVVWHVREFLQEDHGHDYFSWVHAYERMQNSACLICVSRAVEEKMHRVCPGVPTQVVYNGLDTSVFFHEDRPVQPEGLPARLMFSGGIRRSKGTYLVLEAISKLPSNLAYTLDIYGAEGLGRGEHSSEMMAECERLGIDGRVTYHGQKDSLAEAYRSHDILVMASRAEAFGRVTAEAMLCGCLVVGSNSGGTPELISDGRGYLFESGNTSDLAHVLEEAVGNQEEREKRTSSALAYARERFTSEVYVDKVEKIYTSAMTSKSRR